MVVFMNVKSPCRLELCLRKSCWTFTDLRVTLSSGTTLESPTSSTSTTEVPWCSPASFPSANTTNLLSTSSGTRTTRWWTTTRREGWVWPGSGTGRRANWASRRPDLRTRGTTPAVPATPGRPQSTSSSREVSVVGSGTHLSKHREKTKAMRIAGSGGNESKERDQGLKLFVKDSLRLCWDWLVSSLEI